VNGRRPEATACRIDRHAHGSSAVLRVGLAKFLLSRRTAIAEESHPSKLADNRLMP
jgi:hypothetical protein